MARMYYDNDADLSVLKGKTIAIIGYGSQGHAQAQNLRDSGLNVIVSDIPGSENHRLAVSHGFTPVTAREAAEQADLVQILTQDHVQAKLYREEVGPAMKAGKTLLFSHGFNIHFKQIVPAPDIDVIMVAPKGPGHLVHQVTRPLRRDHNHVDVRSGHNLFEVDVKTVRKEKGFARLHRRPHLFPIEFGLHVILREYLDQICLLRRFACCDRRESVRYRQTVILAAGDIGYDDVQPAVTEILSLGVTLTAVSDNRDGFPLQHAEVGIVVVVHACHDGLLARWYCGNRRLSGGGHSFRRETRPVRISSRIPYGFMSSMKLLIFSGSPLTPRVMLLCEISAISALKISPSW